MGTRKLEDIIIDPDVVPNPRTDFGDIEALWMRIEAVGRLVQPLGLWINPEDGEAYLWEGIRRFSALEHGQLTRTTQFNEMFGDGIPVEYFEGDHDSVVDAAIVANVDRKEYTQVELAHACAILRSKNMSTTAIASKIGKSTRHVRRWLQFSDQASDQVVEAVADGAVTIDAAYDVLTLPKEQQMPALKPVATESAKPTRERNVTSARRRNSERSVRRTVREIKQEIELVTSKMDNFLLETRTKPKEVTDILRDGGNAQIVVTIQSELAGYRGALAALNWALGEAEDSY